MIYSLQYLRALAATAVVIFHIGLIFGWNWRPMAAGVDLFFLISGFIMWSVTANKQTRPGEFLARRLIKIVPLYWLFTAVFVVGVTLSPGPFNNHTSQPIQIVMSLFFIPYYDQSGKIVPALDVGWTLNYEMFFYLIFSLSLLLRERYRLPCITLTLVSLVLAGALPFKNAPFEVATSPMLVEFAAGILIAAWHQSGRSLTRGADLLFIVAGLIGIALSFIMQPLEGTAGRVLMWGLPAALILFGALSYEKNHRVWRIEWLKMLGDASYATYLSHPITIAVCKYLLSKAGLERRDIALSQQLLLFTLTFLALMVVGVACYYIFDKPSHDFLRRRINKFGKRPVVRSSPLQ
ncbi:acyltransferase family protein [Rhizobium sp. SRDI969]|uniref:acyltransferase family protein n=1 Tax=Rhizobium sp. SRDI969 TaxID=3138252 RepID=UPI0021A8731D|nr:acyltransferase [Rhizobium leguminosarum]UWM80272.1 acyltransferase [Rhizobium leguminosarum bv. viciae]